MEISTKIYMDYAATTPVDPRVLAAMTPYFTDFFGNPSSVHVFGQVAESALENARQTVADGINAHADEILFTGGGTESDNLALRGVAMAMRQKTGADHILISPVEHHAVARTAQQLAEDFGFILEYLPVDPTGMVHPEDVAARLRPDTALVSVIYANNEIGTVNPIGQIGAVCRQQGVPFHTDAVQAAAYLSIDVQASNIDLLSLGAHKFYGPKGAGVLYVRKGIPMHPIQTGGGQEFGRRSGTQNIPYIVGLAEALRITHAESNPHIARLVPLRDRLIGETLEKIDDSRLTGHPIHRLPNHASFVFDRVDGNALITLLDAAGFACSSGSACKTGNPEPSEVLTAIGYAPSWALGSLRVTLGRDSLPSQVEAFLHILPDMVNRGRRMAAHV
jgi:cysteine desulfurase